MIPISWKRIRNQKYKSIMTIAAMITIILLTSYGIQSARETQLIVTDNLENYSRGSYDILVRPEGARTKIEGHLQTVEENYIGDGAGGISIEEWKKIKEHPEIEIAAPVAALGYFTSNTDSIQLPLLDYPALFEWQFFTSDGINDYPVTSIYGEYYLERIDQEYPVGETFADIIKDSDIFSGG